MSNKIYAVKTGRITGLYNTWDECKAQVNGFSGAEFKSFAVNANFDINNDNSTIAHDIKEYMGWIDAVSDAVSPVSVENNDCTSLSLDELCKIYNTKDKALAYVDGSFDAKNSRYSCGIVIICNGQILESAYADSDENLISMRNVAGEIMGAQIAIEKCIKMGCKTVDLCYDYYGIEKWFTGEWKCNKAGTKAYGEWAMALRRSETLAVTFHKVKGHTGVELNERVDRLAKDVLGIK